MSSFPGGPGDTESLQQACCGEEGEETLGTQGRDSGLDWAEECTAPLQGQGRLQQVQADPATLGQCGPWQQECRGC